MKTTIVLVCGSDSSGKTTTIDKFFGSKYETCINHLRFYHRVIDSVNIYALSTCSPQERAKDFCNVEKVKADIGFRIQECDKKANGKPYVLILSYGIYEDTKREKLNDACFLEPYEWLRIEKDFKVFPWYLQKLNATKSTQKDALARKICLDEKPTTREDYNKSKELEQIVKELIVEN